MNEKAQRYDLELFNPEIVQAVSQAWCAPGCTDIEMDATLAIAICRNVQALFDRIATPPAAPIQSVPDLRMVSMRLKQIANPQAGSMSPSWHALDALYYLTGDQAFADSADAIAAAPTPPAAPTHTERSEVELTDAASEVTPMFLLNVALCIENHDLVATSMKREILAKLHRIADAMQAKRMAYLAQKGGA